MRPLLTIDQWESLGESGREAFTIDRFCQMFGIIEPYLLYIKFEYYDFSDYPWPMDEWDVYPRDSVCSLGVYFANGINIVYLPFDADQIYIEALDDDGDTWYDDRAPKVVMNAVVKYTVSQIQRMVAETYLVLRQIFSIHVVERIMSH